MPVVAFPGFAPLSLPRSKTPDPSVPPRPLGSRAQPLSHEAPEAGAGQLPPAHTGRLLAAPALPTPLPWAPQGLAHTPGSAPPALTAPKLALRLGGQPFELNPAGPQRSLLEVLLMVQDVVLGERLRPFAPGTALGGAAARYLALGERLAPPAVWDVLMEVTEDAPSQAARAAASAQRTSNKGRARHLAAALSVQGPTLTVTSRTGATVLRVHLCAPGQGQVPGALACEQLLLRCQSRAWSASGGLSLPEAMALAASGHYRAPGLGEGQPLPEDVTGALASLVQIWRLQQAGYRPQALPERADLAAVVRLADHLAQQPGPHAASQAAIQLVHHAVAPDWAPVASAAMRQQLGLAATAWAFLSQWQRHMPENFSVSPLVAGLRGLCASHMDRACPDARLAYAITQGLCAGGCTADLWRLLLAARAAGDEAGADAGDQPQVHRDGDMLSVALPIWRTHVFADGPAPGAPLGHLHGTVALTTLCADPALRTVGQRLGRALGCPPLAELFDHPWGATPQARQGLARALRAQLAAPEGCAPPIRSRLLWAMAVLGGDTALAELEDEVRAAFSLQQLCDAWRALPAQPSGADDAVSTALTALLRPHIQALRGAAAAGGALRPVVHTLVQQLGRRGRHDEALALLQTDPPLGAQVGGLQALALLTASLSEPPSPALQAQLLAAVARHKGACQELVHQEASLWRAWSGRPAAAAALADVLANVGAMPQGPLTHWLEALHAAENVAPLMRFVTTAAPQHPALGDVLVNLAELASLTGHEPGLRQALASWDAARGSLTPQLRARVALVLLESAEAQGAANAPVLEVAPHDRLRLAEAVLQGHPGAEERKVAMGILADLTHTPCAVQAMGVVLAHCDLSTLGRLAPHEIHDLFDLMGAFTDDIMPDLSDKTAEQFVDLLIRLPTTTAKEAAAVAPRNVDGLTFLLRRGHFAAGRKLIQCQMRSPAAVRLSLQVFQGSSAVDLGPRWRSFFDHCAQNMQAKPAQRTKSLTSGPPAPRFVMAILVAEGLSTELRAFEERADHASNLEARLEVLDTIIYALQRRHSLVRLLPDELLLQQLEAFVHRHDLGQQGLMQLYTLGSVRMEEDGDTQPQAASTPPSSAEAQISQALRGALGSTLDPIERAMQQLGQGNRDQPVGTEDSLPIELWTVMLGGLRDKASEVQQHLALKSFQHTAGRSLSGFLHGELPQEPLNLRQAIIASKWAAQLLAGPKPPGDTLPPLWPILCCAHLDDPSAVLRLTQLTLSMAETGITCHPITLAIDSLAQKADEPLDAATLQRRQLSALHILMAALIVADTLPPQKFAEEVRRLLEGQQQPLDGLSSLPWQGVIDELKDLHLGEPNELGRSLQAFEARCLAPNAYDPLRRVVHLHAVEQQLDGWILRLHKGDGRTRRHSLNSIFGLMPTFFQISTFTQDASINHVFALLCCNPALADLVREELLAAVYLRPESFDAADPLKVILDILFATDPRVERTLANFLAMERLKQARGVPLPAYWPATRRDLIAQTGMDELRRAQELSKLLATLVDLDGLPQRRFAQAWAQPKAPLVQDAVRVRSVGAPSQRHL